MQNDLWTRYFRTFDILPDKAVQEVDIRLVMEDCEGELNFSDLQLQEGGTSTGHILANREMLSREYTSGEDSTPEPLIKRHFNAVIRGAKVLGIPNRALPAEEQYIDSRVTGGMDYTLLSTSPHPSRGVSFAHFHRTRTFILERPLQASSLLEFKASSRIVAVNRELTSQFTGFYHTIPGLFGKFHVDLKRSGDAEHIWTGSGYMLCEVDTWLKGEKW
ncbi:hypothetical protein [Bacillus horti]|uniref:Uncharacterized protein n=1 Tax=Caldalkalibacillus horti TaxID=77523 RepID=A0ABT9W5B5_9BACI|nr:hypothetical protein [Bacillus horti]MDQ0168441.1 hypothetical protein [Bacillus horti]